MDAPTPFYNTARAHLAAQMSDARTRFGRLNRSKQGVLVLLALLAALVLTGTFAYAIAPDDPPAAPALAARTPTAVPDPFTGSYTLTTGHTQAQILTLHAYHGGFTGTLQTLTCPGGVPHTTQQIVTGTIAADGALRLTLTQPTRSRSSTYRVLRDAEGTALVWQDPQHPAAMASWARLDQPVAAFISGWC